MDSSVGLVFRKRTCAKDPACYGQSRAFASTSFKIEFKDKRVMLCTVRPVVAAVMRSWVAAPDRSQFSNVSALHRRHETRSPILAIARCAEPMVLDYPPYVKVGIAFRASLLAPGIVIFVWSLSASR